MFRFIDRSQALIKLLEWISNFLAKQRGFPILAGIMFIVAAAVLELVNLRLDSTLIELARIFFHNFGLVTALIGILLLEPIGR